MVADASETGGLKPAVATLLLAGSLVLFLLAILFRPIAFLHEKAPFETPPRELLTRAELLLEQLGYAELPPYLQEQRDAFARSLGGEEADRG